MPFDRNLCAQSAVKFACTWITDAIVGLHRCYNQLAAAAWEMWMYQKVDRAGEDAGEGELEGQGGQALGDEEG